MKKKELDFCINIFQKRYAKEMLSGERILGYKLDEETDMVRVLFEDSVTGEKGNLFFCIDKETSGLHVYTKNGDDVLEMNPNGLSPEEISAIRYGVSTH